MIYVEARGIFVVATMKWPLRPYIALRVLNRDEKGKPMRLVIVA